jgi:hypothetical protein
MNSLDDILNKLDTLDNETERLRLRELLTLAWEHIPRHHRTWFLEDVTEVLNE